MSHNHPSNTKLIFSFYSWIKGAINYAIEPFTLENNNNFEEHAPALSLHLLMNTANSCFNFPSYFDKLHKFLSCIFNATTQWHGGGVSPHK